MAASPGFWPLAGLMFATGIGIPMFATLNAQLGMQLGSPVGATIVMFVVGLVLVSALLIVAPPIAWSRLPFDRPWLCFGVVFMIAYAVSITFAAPRMGVGNAVFFVLLGQLVAAATIDHFGLWGAVKSEITARRLAGIAVMAFGVYLARKRVI